MFISVARSKFRVGRVILQRMPFWVVVLLRALPTSKSRWPPTALHKNLVEHGIRNTFDAVKKTNSK